jgi:hypothetical protein
MRRTTLTCLLAVLAVLAITAPGAAAAPHRPAVRPLTVLSFNITTVPASTACSTWTGSRG